ncbi:uncharacterized protein LOC110036473 isoform X2 [Phalaenopsis equestris]|uniref:uncharacterized protein LOC110036473 isoform X2 n=1 Tax=Phalaenopsis equestris TaxID=78828 RepID=UPI0009E63BC3|nr:uncharacterized protein LOC110036473 isoform X2 [Phalaenopsis equestris]
MGRTIFCKGLKWNKVEDWLNSYSASGANYLVNPGNTRRERMMRTGLPSSMLSGRRRTMRILVDFLCRDPVIAFSALQEFILFSMFICCRSKISKQRILSAATMESVGDEDLKL